MAPNESGEITRLSRQAQPPGDEVVVEWEEALAAYVGVGEAAVVNSGRRAMTLILEHLSLGEGHEVIIPAYTLKDLVPLIQRTGAKVVPADIDPETFGILPEAVEERITPSTKAIIALHPFGVPCAIEQVVAIADQRGIPLVEDCAHSLGATAGGRQTGSYGYAGFLSFETTKPVNTFGGGAVCTSVSDLARYVREKTASDAQDFGPMLKKMRNVRLERLLFSSGLAFPFLCLLASPRWKARAERLYRRMGASPPKNIRYSGVQASTGLDKLASLSERIQRRAEKAELLCSMLKPGIRVQRTPEGCAPTWYFFVAILPGPAAPIRKKLLMRGIDAAVEDEIADDCAALLDYRDCPNMADLFRRAIALPMYEDISEAEIARVADALNAAAP